MKFFSENPNSKDLWASATIFDVILPGSHQSGSYPTSESNEDYWKNKFSTSQKGQALSAAVVGDGTAVWDRITAWTKTQGAVITRQFEAGIRWFDLRFEYHTSTVVDSGWYIHNGVFGPIHTNSAGSGILDHLSTYASQEELLVLQFSDFQPSNVATSQKTEWDGFWATVVTKLGNDSIVPAWNGIDWLKGKYMPELQTQYSFLLVTDDKSSVPEEYKLNVWDINDLMVGNPTGETLSGGMKDANRAMLEAGWESNKLQRVHWTLSPTNTQVGAAITSMSGKTTIDSASIGSLEQLNRRIVFGLQEAIDTYALGFSQWGNVLIADYIGKSDIVDVILKLNYNYLSCNDENQGVDSDVNSCAYTVKHGECPSANCQRSCPTGNCTWLSGTLYDPCTQPSECVSLGPDVDSAKSKCLAMDNYYDLMTRPAHPAFCLVHSPNIICDEYDLYYDSLTSYSCAAPGVDGQTFNSPAEQEAYWRGIFDANCYFCASDAQCESGICNKEFQVCISARLRANLTTVELDTDPRDAYVQFNSGECEEFRNDIKPFRFQGEPDADFDFDSIDKAFEKVQAGNMMALLDDPYLGSIFCFALFPLLLGIIMLFAFICTPMCFCCAKSTGKLECFEGWCCCFKKDQQFSKGQILVPFILLVLYSLLILFFCANAIVMNGEISDNILNKGGVIELMNNTMTYATTFMGSVLIPTNALAVGLESAFDRAQILVNSAGETSDLINDVTTSMDSLHNTWVAETLDVPHSSGGKPYVCGPMCVAIIASLPQMRADVSNQAVSASQDMHDVVSDIQRDMLNQEQAIMSDVLDYQTQVQDANDQTAEMRTNVLQTMDMIEGVEDNRSVVFAIFFLIPMFLLIIGLCAYCQAADLGRKLFRLNYCLAFLLSSVTWILFSFFNITVVIWADTCVRLDVMETDITGSELLNQVYSSDTVKKVMDACINGKYLPDAFNLTSSIGFRELENEIVSQLTVDLVDTFDIPTINTFQDFVNSLDANDYQYTVDTGINEYNNHCVQSVTRTTLANPGSHTPPSTFGCDVLWATLNEYYTEEQTLGTTFADKVTRFKADSLTLLTAFNDLENYVINNLQSNLTDIKCSLNPVFEQANTLLNETAWCNQVGVIYGEMKQKSCVDLFKNFEHTNRSLLVVAIFSMFIGFLSVALGRRINRQFNLFNKKAWNFGDIVR